METSPLSRGRGAAAPVRPADVSPAASREAAASISVQVHRLVLDGFSLPAGGERQVQTAFQEELIRLLSVADLPSGVRVGGARRTPPGGPVSIPAPSDPVDLGCRIARAIHEAMGG